MGYCNIMKIYIDGENDCRGFTLVEIIAVLIIFGILAAVAVSRISFPGNELYVERDLLKSNLRYAQLRALTNNAAAASTWGISLGGNSYTLLKDGIASITSFPGEHSATHNMKGGVTITAPTNVTYDYWGSPGGSSIIVTLQQGTKTVDITIIGNTGYIP